MHRRTTAFFALPLVFIVAGCGGSSSMSPPAAPLTASAATPSGLTVTLSQNTSSVAAGGSITYTLRLANDTRQPITYQENLGCGYVGLGAVFVVADSAGNPVYPPQNQGSCTAVGISGLLTLAPGQSETVPITPAITLPTAGRYFATASFLVGTLSETGVPVTTVGPLEVDAR